LTRALTYLVRMVDLGNSSRHCPSEMPQPFGVALCLFMPVVRDTLGHSLRRFNENAHHWGSLDPCANIFGQNGRFDQCEPSRSDLAVRRQHFNSAPCPWMLVVQGTLGHPSRRFNENAHHWGSLDPRANIFGQNGRFDQCEPSRSDPAVRRQHFNSAPCPWMLVVQVHRKNWIILSASIVWLAGTWAK
jgi:hypothetical protein